jgi:hypothetical protein
VLEKNLMVTARSFRELIQQLLVSVLVGLAIYFWGREEKQNENSSLLI